MSDTARTIVVGVDRSKESDDALDWARSLAVEGDRLLAVHAWNLPVVTSDDALMVGDPAEVERLSAAGLAELLDEIGDDRLEPVNRRGHAGRTIVEAADEVDADMIVVGHRGNSRLSLMLGSTANYVVHHTERPVVVVRGDAPRPPRRVVVGVDDFDDPADSPSVRALQWAYGLPGVEEISAIHAWYLPPLAVGVFPATVNEFDSMDSAAQAVTDRVLEAAGAPPDGVEVTGGPARGTGGFALIEASRDTDLVVLGRRGRGGFSELLLGSTSAEVAAHAHAPVAVIR